MVLDYIDPGYGDKMLNSGGTALADNITIVENDTYNPFGGVAFTNNGAARSIFFPGSVPPKPIITGSGQQSGQRGIKFSVYCDFDSPPSNFYAGFNGNGGYASGTTGYNIGIAKVRLDPSTGEWYPEFRGIKANPNPFASIGIKGFHNISIYLYTGGYSSGSTSHSIIRTTMVLDNIKYSSSWDTTNSTEKSRTSITSLGYISASGYYMSNILSAATLIPNQMQVVKLPIKSTDTDMTAGENGEYIATGVDQTLLQTIDTAQLAENYGTNTAISHIVVGGFPCYTSSAGANLVGISKKDGGITTHGSCVASTDSLGAVSDFWEVDGQTLADLANIQVGWKAGA